MKDIVEKYFNKKIDVIQNDKMFFFKGIQSGVLMKLYPDISSFVEDDFQKFDGLKSILICSFIFFFNNHSFFMH